MLKLANRRKLIFATVLTILVAIGLPTVAFSQNGRGRRSGQDRRYERGYDRQDNGNWQNKRKSRKFINGHDARDGRWDGRGPRRNRTNDGWSGDDYKYQSVYRNRTRRNNYDRYYRPVNQSRSYYAYPNSGNSNSGGGLLDLIVGGFIN